MSSKDFLDQLNKMVEAGETHSDKLVSKTVAKAKFELGFSGFCAGHNMKSLFQPISEPTKVVEVKAAVASHIESLGGKPRAVLGLRYTIPAENIISFQADFGKERFIQRFGEEADFDKILNAIKELELPLGEWVWVAYENVDSPTAVAKGEAGKFETREGTMVYPKIVVPVELFASGEAAQAAAGGVVLITNNSQSQWSDTARKNLFPEGIDKEVQNEILDFYHQIVNGKPLPGRDKLPYEANATPTLKQLSAKKELAELYQIETSDIDLMLLDEVF